MYDKNIYIDTSSPFHLVGYRHYWEVVSGRADVFYVRLDLKGNYTSELKYLHSVKEGDILFSLATVPGTTKQGIRLIANATNCTLKPIHKNELLLQPIDKLQNQIDTWILGVSDSLSSSKPPRQFIAIDDCRSVEADLNQVLYPMKGVRWLLITEGKVSLYDHDNRGKVDRVLSCPVPVSVHLRMKVLSKRSSLEVMRTDQAIEKGTDFLIALFHIQNYLKTLIENQFAKTKVRQETLLNAKNQNDLDLLSQNLKRIGAIVLKAKDSIAHSESKLTHRNPLMQACQFIGNEIGVGFKASKQLNFESSTVTNQIFAISQVSGVRARKVVLRDNWWQKENGHLLAFTKESMQPLALIQKNSNQYILKDPSKEEEVVMTEDIAKDVSPIAYVLVKAFDKPMTTVRDLWVFAIQGLKRDPLLLLLAALCGSFIGLLVPVLSGVLFDDVIPQADRGFLLEVFLIMIAIGFASALLQLVQGVFQLRIETKSNINIQAGLMDHLLRLPVAFFRKYTSGDLTNRALSVNAIRQILSSTVLTAILSGAFSIVNLGLLFYYQSQLAWMGLGLVVLAISFIIANGLVKLKYDRKIASIEGDIQGFLFEFLSGISKIRVSGAENRIFALWADKFSSLKTLGFKSGSRQNLVEVFNASFPLFTNIFFFAFLYHMYMKGGLNGSIITVGAFMAFISAFRQFLNDCLNMCLTLVSSLNVVTLYERVQPLLNEQPETQGDSADPGELVGEIEFNSVSFRYNEAQPLILKNVSFQIKPGEMVAFVGPSGSGKSTVMRLLLGFETIENGSIFYDGQSFDTLNKDLVRRQIGVVLQHGALMSGSIFKNIVGNSELTLDDAWDAAKMAGMEEDIKHMPMEMHTVVSEGAGTFSGGQRQRLMIARAIAHRPRILFMDEATSALDNKTQDIVSRSLEKLQATRIVIAHRLSTIMNADRIFVMEDGEIVEIGSFNELMARNGLFSKLAKRQMT